MQRLAIFVAVGGLAFAAPAHAYEYELQVPTAGNVVQRHFAGYAFVGNAVTGDCSYETVGACSGRGCHPSYHWNYQGCSWDLYGNLLGVTPGEPPAPAPISTANGLTIYATNARGGSTGVDTAHGNTPFVNTITAQYAWAASPTVYFNPADKPLLIALQLASIGDLPLVVGSVVPNAALGLMSVRRTTCTAAPVQPGKMCKMVLKYDPTKIARGDNPYTAYDHFDVGLVSNSGLSPTTGATVETPIPPGGGN